MPPIQVGAWLRNNIVLQSGESSKKMDDLAVGVYGEVHLSGKLTPIVGYTLNLYSAAGPTGSSRAGGLGIQDAIVSFDFHKLFNVWLGQLLVPVDRTNFSGPFFIIPWNYPGVYGTTGGFNLVMPIEPILGRDLGTVVWGDYNEGKFKYFLGAFAERAADTVLFSGRLSVAPIGKDGGFWGQSTYYGSQNLLAFGVGGQYAKKGSQLKDTTGAIIDTDDFGEINADALGEFKVGDGAITAEAAYYHFTGKYNRSGVRDMTANPAKDAFMGMLAYMSPTAGFGKLQPYVRYQAAGGNNLKMWMFDAGLNYIIKGPQLRVTLNYTHTDMDKDGGPGRIGNAMTLGVQSIMF